MGSTAATHVLSTSTLSEILDDLCIRFLIFLPEEELSSIERICFQIEEAHWFYEDFIREINPGVPNLHLRQFIHQLLNHVPRSLISHIPLWKTETAFTEFMSYKTRVPVRGVIMLNVNMDKAVLVKGWKSGASWSFPRGKIDQNEDDRDCAIRETYEETGFDLTGMVGAEDKIDINIREQDMRLYIAPGVPEDFRFAPRTRKEISKIAWHKLSELPGYSAKKGQREENIRSGKFFLVAPFIRELRKWISTNGKQWLEQQQGAAASIQRQLATAAQKLELGEATLKAEEPPLSPPEPAPPITQPEDSTTSLKNLLGIPVQPEAPAMTAAEQDDASRRLREMIGGISQPQHAAPTVTNGSNRGDPLSENPNAKMLLSILQPSGPTTSSHHSPPSHRVSAHPNFMGFPPTGNQNQRPNSSTPMQHPPPHPLQTRPSFGPMLQNSQASMPSPGGWQQGQQQRMNTFPLPSPPPTSRFGPPPYPQPQQQQQQRGAPLPMNQFFANPPMSMAQPGVQMPQQGNMMAQHGNMMAGNAMLQHFGQRDPPTPVDSFHPPPQQQIRHQDSGQAGALLSILKGTRTPVQTPPVAHWQPEPNATATMPSEPPPQQAALPSQKIAHPQLPQKSQMQVPKQMPQPSGPPKNPMTPPPPSRQAVPGSNPAPLRSPPPRGPKVQTSQRNSPQRQQPQRHRNNLANNRSSTAAPVSQAYQPPPRPTTTQPRHHTPPPPLRHGTPVAIDHYGAQKTTALPTTNFDRRESVSGERAQTLLAMFRKPQAPASPMSMPMDEAVMSSPEMEQRKPVQRPPPRLSTAGVGASSARPGLARTPTGLAKANLLAYLEGVASERNDGGGGGVPLS